MGEDGARTTEAGPGRSANRFEQVDEPADDAMTLILHRDGDKQWGVITCPAAATGGRLPKGFNSDELPLKEAFRTGIRMANDFKTALVVVDPQGLWVAEWGTLFRWEDEDAPGPA